MNLSILTKLFVTAVFSLDNRDMPGKFLPLVDGLKSGFRDTVKIVDTFTDNMIAQRDNQFEKAVIRIFTSTCVRRLFFSGATEGGIEKIRR